MLLPGDPAPVVTRQPPRPPVYPGSLPRLYVIFYPWGLRFNSCYDFSCFLKMKINWFLMVNMIAHRQRPSVGAQVSPSPHSASNEL
jgi:hypothetical protein